LFGRFYANNTKRIGHRSRSGQTKITEADQSHLSAGLLRNFAGFSCGRFRSNWQAGLGSRPTGEEPTTKFEKGQPATISEVQAVQAELSGLGETDSSIYFTNNLPYAERLENGHSSQNQGFVARAVRNMEKRFSTL
jgi:hypothetical protein